MFVLFLIRFISVFVLLFLDIETLFMVLFAKVSPLEYCIVLYSHTDLKKSKNDTYFKADSYLAN